jgi:hypothetical protein
LNNICTNNESNFDDAYTLRIITQEMCFMIG